MIKVRNLTKLYGNKTAIDSISFDIERGKIYGFLGQNGAGKSTTMNIITGCLAATDGSVTIDGKDIFKSPIEAKRHIGYLPEIPPLYLDMTPFEYLTFVAKAKGVDSELAYRQVKEAMELTQISDVSDRLIKTLSKGYKQRVGIAQALLGDPDIIILDEPTVGLDPRQITEIRALIRRLGEEKTVIISSHILAEISEVCNHVIVISHGKIVADDSIENLESSMNTLGKLDITVKCDYDTAAEIFNGIDAIDEYSEDFTIDGYSRFTLHFAPECDPSEEIFFAFADKRIAITDMSHERLTLEDIFLKLTESTVTDQEESEEENEEEFKEEEYVPQFSDDSDDSDADNDEENTDEEKEEDEI